MKRTSLICFVLLLVVMAVATVVGQCRGLSSATDMIYGSWWFALLWGAAVIAGSAYAFPRFKGRLHLWLLHLSLIIILSGALLTELTARHGRLQLLPKIIEGSFVLDDKMSTLSDMPLTICLDTFEVKYYPASTMPSNYVSHVTVKDKTDGQVSRQNISMNNILSFHHYRFYQLSYYPENGSSILAVNYDPYGIPVSYAGYFILFLSSLMLLFSRQGGFNKLLTQFPSRMRCNLLLFLILIAVITVVGVIFMVGEKTYLMPVLRSRLLYVHVSTLVFAYLLMLSIFVLSVIALIRMATHHDAARLSQCSRLLLYPSVSMMGTGIFLGAIWANISWGNYWSWDPKETWALIAFLVYAAGVHTQSIKSMRDNSFFHGYMIFTFVILLMTYLGVNCFFSGMHSYA